VEIVLHTKISSHSTLTAGIDVGDTLRVKANPFSVPRRWHANRQQSVASR
jgi:hypothetical protein